MTDDLGAGKTGVPETLKELMERSRGLRDDVVRENDRLRAKVEELEGELTKAVASLAKEFEDTRRESVRLKKAAEELSEENRDFAKRNVELEDHATSLANLYAATFQLHSTLDPDAVVRCVVEIAVNLIGAHEFVLVLTDDAKGDLVVQACEGERFPVGTRFTGFKWALERAAAELKRTVFSEEFPETRNVPDGPLCCAPLFFRGRLLGVLTIFQLLSHKKTFSTLDRELFDLLGEQAALALVSSNAYVSVDRKLKTVQRFMDLLKG